MFKLKKDILASKWRYYCKSNLKRDFNVNLNYIYICKVFFENFNFYFVRLVIKFF